MTQSVPDAGVLEDRQLDLDQRTHAIDVAFASCKNLDASIVTQWVAFYSAYVVRSNQAAEDIGSSATMIMFPATYVGHLLRIQGEQAQDQIDVGKFAHVANVTCGTGIPEVAPPPPASPVDYLRWGTYLAVGLGGLYLLGVFGPTLAGLLPARRRRGT